ncbi:MAG: flagellar basal-body rod protein FlgF [Anaerovibrio sp.]|uniref:flagellar basal-body rod protein FlgF n=1 Tax=Anaerovibrio sp. TaxID=1872532 RepID=UPI0025FBF68D|nr:flagellar basal-body rod protein FlgF [Anaerovibrio sp.]MCR5176212.1 flagellar basal-body rod protein FlgF [Anaerovibrio sp.]
MWRGLYTAATGMITESCRTDVIANNLANANTTSYKRDDAVSSEFEPMLMHRIDDLSVKQRDVTTFKGFSLNNGAPVIGELGLGSSVDEIVTDHSQGAFQTTGNTFDLAISGEGYFLVDTPQGQRYTRDGNFYRSANGRLVNVNGYNVLDDRGRPIDIPAETADVVIGVTGNISADRVPVARIGLFQFEGGDAAMVKQGSNLYRAPEGARRMNANGEIQQGILERSNTNVVSEMVNLIANYRAYEANSKAVVTQDTMLDKSVNEVGRGV